MGHDASKVLMGANESSVKEVSNHKGSIEAGLVVKLTTGNALSNTTGGILGISMGRDLSDAGRTAIARKGLRVPVKLTTGLTIVPGTPVYIVDATGEAHNAAAAGRTLVNAVFASVKLTGIGEDGLSKDVALIDFPGGL
jgi:hypothetical protein